jgi:hypothetical protein
MHISEKHTTPAARQNLSVFIPPVPQLSNAISKW